MYNNGDTSTSNIERAAEEITPSPGYSIFSSEWFTIRMGKYHKPPHKGKLKGGFRYNHQWNQLVGVSNQTGLVVYKSLWNVIGADQLFNTTGQAAGVSIGSYLNPSSWTQTLFGFDPFAQGAATLGLADGGINQSETPIGSTSTNVKLYQGVVYLDKINGEMWIQNYAKVMTEFEIWWCSPKVITGSLPEVDWQGGEDVGMFTTANQVAGGEANYPAPGCDLVTNIGGNNFGALPGVSPFNTRYWNSKWRVVKRVKHQVLPGGVKRLKYALHYNKYLSMDQLHRATLGDTTKKYIPGLTLIPMIVAKSGPVWDNISTFGNKLTLGPVDLRLHGFYNVHAKYVPAEQQVTQYNYSDGNLMVVTGVTNTKTIDASGTEVAYTTNA